MARRRRSKQRRQAQNRAAREARAARSRAANTPVEERRAPVEEPEPRRRRRRDVAKGESAAETRAERRERRRRRGSVSREEIEAKAREVIEASAEEESEIDPTPTTVAPARKSSPVFSPRHRAAGGAAAAAHPLDVRDPEACAALVGDLVDRGGGIHTLVHSAGPHVPMVHLSKVRPEQFAAQVEADLLGFFNIAHACLPALREARGSIVVVTSAATRRYPVRDGLSATPKGGVEQLAFALAAEEGRFGVRVNCVGPGMLVDGMAERLMSSGDLDERALAVTRANIPLRRFGTARDIAEAAAFLASSRANFISGQKLDVDGGYGV